jgi:hypothetical protein
LGRECGFRKCVSYGSEQTWRTILATGSVAGRRAMMVRLRPIDGRSGESQAFA